VPLLLLAKGRSKATPWSLLLARERCIMAAEVWALCFPKRFDVTHYYEILYKRFTIHCRVPAENPAPNFCSDLRERVRCDALLSGAYFLLLASDGTSLSSSTVRPLVLPNQYISLTRTHSHCCCT